jgi:hypothetical protein
MLRNTSLETIELRKHFILSLDFKTIQLVPVGLAGGVYETTNKHGEKCK